MCTDELPRDGNPHIRVICRSIMPRRKLLLPAFLLAILQQAVAIPAEPVAILRGHTLPVWSIAATADGKSIISDSSDPEGKDPCIRFWDVKTRKSRHISNPFERWIFDVHTSPDGRTISSSDRRSSVKIWNLDTGDLRATLDCQCKDIKSVAYAPDGKILAVACDNAVQLWDTSTNERLHVCNGHTGSVYAIAFSPDGETIGSASADHDVRLWAVDSGDTRHVLKAHSDDVRSVEFAPDGKTLLTAGHDARLILWNPATGEKLSSTEDTHRHGILSARFSPEGGTIVTVEMPTQIDSAGVALWDAKTLKRKATLEKYSAAPSGVAFSPDGSLLAAAHWDGTIRIWDVEAGLELKPLKGHRGYVRAINFFPDGRRIISGGDDATIRIWETPHLKPREQR